MCHVEAHLDGVPEKQVAQTNHRQPEAMDDRATALAVLLKVP